MQDGNKEAAYVLGSSDAERERLVQQAHLFGGQTRSLSPASSGFGGIVIARLSECSRSPLEERA
jgi:hypothetical protein